jgi:ATP-dependent exoDNAse (exonuclease V) beta subunit
MGIGADIGNCIHTTPYGSRVDVRIIGNLTRAEYYKKMKKGLPRDVSVMMKTYEQASVADVSFAKNEYSVSELSEKYLKGRGEKKPVVLPLMPVDELLSDDVLKSRFGTLCHLVLKLTIRKGICSKPDIPASLLREIPRVLIDPMMDAAVLLCNGFLNSELGAMLKKASIVETEYPFLYRLERGGENYYIHGIVDLFFESEQGACIIDFKTDAIFDASSYFFQLAFYRLAIETLTGREISCYIFPLRSKKPVEVTESITEEDVLRLIADNGSR